MRAVLQRVKQAAVEVDGKEVSRIGQGILELGFIQVLLPVSRRIHVGNVSGQQFMTALGKGQRSLESRNRR